MSWFGTRAQASVARRSLLAVMLLLALLGVALPHGPASAEPAPSTTRLAVFPVPPAHQEVYVTVETEGDVAASGVVVITLDGAEYARASLRSDAFCQGCARLLLELSPGAQHVLTATYLGTAEVAGSSDSEALTVPLPQPGVDATGSFSVGEAAFAVTGERPFFSGGDGGPFYASLTGQLAAAPRYVAFQSAVDVAGVGTVTFEVAPRWAERGMRATVGSDRSMVFEPLGMSFEVRTISVDGVRWAGGDCTLGPVPVTLSGEVTDTGLSFGGTGSPLAPLGPSACDGRGAMVNAALAGAVALDLQVEGRFPPPPPPGTPTTTTLEVTGSNFDVADQLKLRATVTVPGGHVPVGTVEFRSEGAVLSTATLRDGVAESATATTLPVGSVEFTATYTGYGALLLPSTGSSTVDIAGPPDGRPSRGQLTLGSNPPAVFPDSVRLVGADFDPVTGQLGAGSFWFPLGSVQVDTGFVGLVDIQYRMTQVADAAGHVDQDGTVTFGPASFRFESRSYVLGGGPPIALTDCATTIEATLTGTADALGLHLSASNVALPPVPPTGCNGLGGFVNSRLGSTASLALEVDGDFRRDDAAEVAVVTYFPTVAQYDQTYLRADVASNGGGSTPSGEVTFRDGETVLGVAPVQTDGSARMVATMNEAGTRTILATYSGDATYNPGSDTVAIDVTAMPDGLDMRGSIKIGDVEVGVPVGSQLVPQQQAPGDGGAPLPASPASMWFRPSTVNLALPGYGDVEAEVRLVQSGELSVASIGGDGSIDGLAGTFALHVRRVTTASGVTSPLGCLNLVLVAFDGQLRLTDADLSTVAGGAGRIPLSGCTGVGRAVAERLADVDVGVELQMDL